MSGVTRLFNLCRLCAVPILVGLAGSAVLGTGAYATRGMQLDSPAATQAALRAALFEQRRAEQRSKRLDAEAARATVAADRAQREAAALAARVQQAEAGIAAAEARIALADLERAALREDLGREQGPLVRLTAALQQLTRRPVVLSVLRPGSVRDVVYTRAMLASAVPAVEQRTAGLRTSLARSRALRLAALRAAACEARAQACGALFHGGDRAGQHGARVDHVADRSRTQHRQHHRAARKLLQRRCQPDERALLPAEALAQRGAFQVGQGDARLGRGDPCFGLLHPRGERGGLALGAIGRDGGARCFRFEPLAALLGPALLEQRRAQRRLRCGGTVQLHSLSGVGFRAEDNDAGQADKYRQGTQAAQVGQACHADHPAR